MWRRKNGAIEIASKSKCLTGKEGKNHRGFFGFTVDWLLKALK